MGMQTEERDSQRQRLTKSLNSLAGARQTKLDADTQRLYANRLAGYDERHIAAAFRELAETPRQEFQPAFPDLGTVIATIERYRDERKNTARFVACDECTFGWLIVKRDGDYEATECECLRRWRGGLQAYAPDPIREHQREVAAHPERFTPVNAVMIAVREVLATKQQRLADGKPMTGAEIRQAIRSRTEELRREWLKGLEREPVTA